MNDLAKTDDVETGKATGEVDAEFDENNGDNADT
jgi:hypothetical protein